MTKPFIQKKKNTLPAIFFTLFFSGFCGLLYEIIFLLISNIIIGASAVATSFVLSLFLFGLALGGLLGGALAQKNINHKFILFFTNLSSAALGILALFTFQYLYPHLNILAILALGTFIILTIPLLSAVNIPLSVKILESEDKKNSTGFVYFSNTIGSVLGALVSGLILIPALGFIKSMFLAIILNLFTSLIFLSLNIKKKGLHPLLLCFFFMLSIFLFHIPSALNASDLKVIENIYLKKIETEYVDPIKPLYSSISPYQHILIAKSQKYGKELYLNGEIQVSQADSEKYHEFLILPALAAHPNPKKILIAGEGDGGGLYQILKYDFDIIDHVELDKQVIEISKQYLPEIHRGALDDPKINRHIMDARQFVKKAERNYYDVIVLAFPDPYKLEIASLFSKEFYAEIKKILTKDGILVLQAGEINPSIRGESYLNPQACILKTVKSTFPQAHLYLCSLSSWANNSFIIASLNNDPRISKNELLHSGEWYKKESHKKIFHLPRGMEDSLNNNEIKINTVINPMLHLYMQHQG